MLIVGLTGPIASGKTQVSKFFREKGIPVCSDDDLIDELYRNQKNINKLAELFDIESQNSYYPNIKSAVFKKVKEEGSFARLEEYLYPMLWTKRFYFLLKSFIANPFSICVLEIPLLIENDLQDICDVVIITNCPYYIRESRAMLRPTMTTERFDFIEKNQIDVEKKLEFADYIVDTEQDFSLVKENVNDIYNDLTIKVHDMDFLKLLNWRSKKL